MVGSWVISLFGGTGSCSLAALKEGRNVLSLDPSALQCQVTEHRVAQFRDSEAIIISSIPAFAAPVSSADAAAALDLSSQLRRVQERTMDASADRVAAVRARCVDLMRNMEEITTPEMQRGVLYFVLKNFSVAASADTFLSRATLAKSKMLGYVEGLQHGELVVPALRQELRCVVHCVVRCALCIVTCFALCIVCTDRDRLRADVQLRCACHVTVNYCQSVSLSVPIAID